MRGGTKKRRRRSCEEWLSYEAPELRIIPDDLWEAAHRRFRETRTVFARGSSTGQLAGRPSRLDLDSPYLLSGIARCGVCDGAIISMTRANGKGKRANFYGCAFHHKRGHTICRNTPQIPQAALDRAVLDAVANVPR